VLVVLALRARPALWEVVALVGLAALTLRTSRSGVWLLFLAAAPAAREVPVSTGLRPRVALPLLLALTAAAVVGVARGPIETGASDELVGAAVDRAAGTPILAEPLVSEQVVLAGGRVWLANPIDAFPRSDQRTYLDWVAGRPQGDRALSHAARVVITTEDGDADDRMRRNPRFQRGAAGGQAVMYVRRR
jgi:hypothetical protein